MSVKSGKKTLSFDVVHLRNEENPIRGHVGNCLCKRTWEGLLVRGLRKGYPQLISADEPHVDNIPYLWDFGATPEGGDTMVETGEINDSQTETWFCARVSVDIVSYFRPPVIYEDPEGL